MTEFVKVTAIYEFVKLVVIIYLAKEGHLADYISLIFDLIILSQSIALRLCYNKNSRTNILFVTSDFIIFLVATKNYRAVKLPNNFNKTTSGDKIERTSAFWSTSHNQDTINTLPKPTYVPEKVDWLASIDRINDRTSELFNWIAKKAPQPIFPEQVAKIRK